MSTCETCRHRGGRARYGDYWYCDLLDSEDGAKPRSKKAWPQDAEGFHAYLIVKLDFGCVDWEGREVSGEVLED